jgi:hypothetical protein
MSVNISMLSLVNENSSVGTSCQTSLTTHYDLSMKNLLELKSEALTRTQFLQPSNEFLLVIESRSSFCYSLTPPMPVKTENIDILSV